MSASAHDVATCPDSGAAFASLASCTPFALFALLGAPVAWWSDAMFCFCGALVDVTVSAMTYPYELPGPDVAMPQEQHCPPG